MLQKTAHEVFIEWLNIATLEELEEELLTLGGINVKIVSQIEEHDVRAKTNPVSPESEEWRLRASHSQRFGWYQMKAIEHRIRKVKTNEELKQKEEIKVKRLEVQELQLKVRLKNAEIKLEEAKLSEKTKEIMAENDLIKNKNKFDRERGHDQKWIKAAKTILPHETFMEITKYANLDQD